MSLPMKNLVDPEVTANLKELLGDGYGLLVETFIHDTKVRVSLLEAAITQVDLLEIANQAHAIKGSSRNLGLNLLGDSCQKIEALARAGESGEYPPLFADVEQYFAAACGELTMH